MKGICTFMFKAVIFDLDGTLADTIDDIGYSINQMLELHGFPKLTRKEHLANINNGAFQLVRRSLPENYRENEDFIRSCLAEYEHFYDAHHMCETVAYDGISDVLTILSKSEVKLAVLSNKQDGYVKDIISTLFPSIKFGAVYGMLDLPAKPDPSSALKIANELKVLPSEVAFVGDSHVDMMTAKNAGMYPIGVSWGYRDEQLLKENGACLICHNARELSEFIQAKL